MQRRDLITQPLHAALKYFRMTIPVSEFQIRKAAQNWRDWQDVYEHAGSARDSPLLIDAAKFGKFLRMYSVQRTIRRSASDELRELLRSPQFQLTALLQDITGAALDQQEPSLREQFGVLQGQRGLRSALSKIAAFLAPHAFNAWDRCPQRTETHGATALTANRNLRRISHRD